MVLLEILPIQIKWIMWISFNVTLQTISQNLSCMFWMPYLHIKPSCMSLKLDHKILFIIPTYECIFQFIGLLKTISSSCETD